MKNITHQTLVLSHLKQGKTLSQAEAIYHFNCYRLSAVIQRLRIAGHDIVTHNKPNCQQVRLSNDGVLINSNIHINHVQ